jgi:hypothetical protein
MLIRIIRGTFNRVDRTEKGKPPKEIFKFKPGATFDPKKYNVSQEDIDVLIERGLAEIVKPERK